MRKAQKVFFSCECGKLKNIFERLTYPEDRTVKNFVDSVQSGAQKPPQVQSQGKTVRIVWLSLKVGRGRGTWCRGDVGTRGREDFGTRRRAGIQGRDKQIAPDVCAELVKYFI